MRRYTTSRVAAYRVAEHERMPARGGDSFAARRSIALSAEGEFPAIHGIRSVYRSSDVCKHCRLPRIITKARGRGRPSPMPDDARTPMSASDGVVVKIDERTPILPRHALSPLEASRCVERCRTTRARRALAAVMPIFAAISILAAPANASGEPSVAYVTSERSGVYVLDADNARIIRQIDVGGRGARGIAITADGQTLITANKGTGDLTVIDRISGSIVRRVPVGDSPEFVRVLGRIAYVTYEPKVSAASAKAGAKDGDDDDGEGAFVAAIDIDKGTVLYRSRSGKESEGLEFSFDGRKLLVANEGDNALSVLDRASGKIERVVDVAKYGARPRGIKRSPDGKHYVVTLENADKLLVLDDRFNVQKSVPVKAGPYGVSFSPDGRSIVVAAARAGVLQELDAETLALKQEVAVGKRCWHFSFIAASSSRIVVACGRSDAVYVVDLSQPVPVTAVSDVPGPWGMVTFPREQGSLDTMR